MNKRDAKDTAFNNDKPWKYYADLLKAQGVPVGQSKLNKSLTKVQALDIFERAIAPKDLEEIPKGNYLDFHNRLKLSRDGLFIHNILREFG